LACPGAFTKACFGEFPSDPIATLRNKDPDLRSGTTIELDIVARVRILGRLRTLSRTILATADSAKCCKKDSIAGDNGSCCVRLSALGAVLTHIVTEVRIECGRASAPRLPPCSSLIQSTLFEAPASSPIGKEAIPSDRDLISILEGNNAGERRGCGRFCYSKAIQKGVYALEVLVRKVRS